MKSLKNIPILVSTLFSLLLASLIYRISLHCTSYFDLGIYTEALSRISWDNLNPFIPGRNIHILNDHFDPIIIPAAFLAHFFQASVVGIALDCLALLLCWFPIRMLRDHGKISHSLAAFSYAFILLNHATIDAIQTPFHPTTWATLPLTYLFAFYSLGLFRPLLISMIFLFACREEFPLVGLPLAFVLWLDGKRKESTIVSLVTVFWLGFVFIIRPKIFSGHFENYGAGILQGLMEDPISVLRKNFNVGSIRMFLERTLPLLLLLSASKIRVNMRSIIKILLIASPILAVRFVSTQWAFHYGTAAVIAFLFIFISCINPVANKLRWTLSILFLGITFIAEPIKVFSNHRGRCINNPERLAEISKAQTWLQNSGKQNLLLENNLASTQFLKTTREQTIHMLCSPAGSASATFDAVLVEKPESGDAWPCGYQRINELIALWKSSPDVHVVTDNEFVFLAEGKISPDR